MFSYKPLYCFISRFFDEKNERRRCEGERLRKKDIEPDRKSDRKEGNMNDIVSIIKDRDR